MIFLPLIFLFSTGFILGLIIGSFTTALLYRDSHGLSIVSHKKTPERSKCTYCEHKLSWKDLVPLFSWVFLRGRCRYCNHEIGRIYPLIELFCGVTSSILFLAYGLSFEIFFFLALYPPTLVLILNGYDNQKPTQKLIVYFCVVSAFMALIGSYVYQVDFINVFKGLISYIFVGVVISLLSTFLFKKPYSKFEFLLFVACGLWLGEGSLLFFVILHILTLLIFHYIFIDRFRKPITPSILSSFFIIILAGATVDVFSFLKSVY